MVSNANMFCEAADERKFNAEVSQNGSKSPSSFLLLLGNVYLKVKVSVVAPSKQ